MNASRLLSLLLCLLTFGAMTPLAAQDEDPLPAAVTKLAELGILSDPGYWLENARRQRRCDGAKVGEVIIAAARRQGAHSTDLAGALDHLARRRVLSKTDYWLENAVTGKECSGRQVASLLSRIASTTR